MRRTYLDGVGPVDLALAAHPAVVLGQTGLMPRHMVGLVRADRGVKRGELFEWRGARRRAVPGWRARSDPRYDGLSLYRDTLDAAADVALHGGTWTANLATQVRMVAVERVE